MARLSGREDRADSMESFSRIRKKIEECLQMVEWLLDERGRRIEMLTSVIQGSPIPQFVIDREHRVVYWNKALEHYSKIKAADIVGTTRHWKAFYKEERPCMADLLVEGAVDEMPRWYGNKYSKSKLLEEAFEATDFFPGLGDGGKWLYFTATAIKDSKGNVIGAVETLEDVTERKKAAEELQNAKRQAEMYLDLMGHDINNMNQACMGYLEMALAIAGGEERRLLQSALDSLNSSSRLITNVRKLQMVERGGMKVVAMDVDKVLKSVITRFSSVPGREVTIGYTACPCMVKANELLYDVFENIVGNSIKHSSGRLSIGVRLDRVSEAGKAYCRVSIEDDGPGIPDEVKKELFLGLKRGRTMGHGIGLYLVYMLVSGYGGRVAVEDRVPGDHTKGARFVVLLPAIGPF